MEIDYQAMRGRFQDQESSDLIVLYRKRTLTLEAEAGLLSVLTERGVAVPEQLPNTEHVESKPIPRWLVILLSILVFKFCALGIYKVFTSDGSFWEPSQRLLPLYGPLPFVIVFIFIPMYVWSFPQARHLPLFKIANIGRKVVAFFLALKTIAFGAQMLGGKVQAYSYTITLLCVNILWISILFWPWSAFSSQGHSESGNSDETKG